MVGEKTHAAYLVCNWMVSKDKCC